MIQPQTDCFHSELMIPASLTIKRISLTVTCLYCFAACLSSFSGMTRAKAEAQVAVSVSDIAGISGFISVIASNIGEQARLVVELACLETTLAPRGTNKNKPVKADPEQSTAQGLCISGFPSVASTLSGSFLDSMAFSHAFSHIPVDPLRSLFLGGAFFLLLRFCHASFLARGSIDASVMSRTIGLC